MLRTNTDLLAFIGRLYTQQTRKEDVILRSFSKGDRLLDQDVQISKVMVISDGVAKCFITEENDKDYLFEFLGKGEIIGEIEALKNRGCLCTVEAISAVNAYVMSASFFLSLLDKNLEMNKILLQVLADRILNTSSRASFQQLYSLEHGLSKLLQLQQKEQIVLSRDDMAAYLGITVRSLNRALKQLKQS
ncbi:CRP-like cAMP-binding protein [Pedobacter cryoconitis]|uniref:CRP-like cAMP-binding protein n=1 Tax=Pedobacter cryoconitis TaxID=188932 RepID=A0A7W9DZB9_9SPHI|nr:Crp/Fnr family transcriptional regulator [Pedobacter cryoconitis]MBB5637147.1 CRP-like cAMP-binding protein [Pedobacter cryoconitis]MBB6273914.1 CRP-like cAMP-binding protein [Pedobacter cryoconitis]